MKEIKTGEGNEISCGNEITIVIESDETSSLSSP